jgi:hypothetical protein
MHFSLKVTNKNPLQGNDRTFSKRHSFSKPLKNENFLIFIQQIIYVINQK